MGLLRLAKRAPRALKKIIAYTFVLGLIVFIVPTALNFSGFRDTRLSKSGPEDDSSVVKRDIKSSDTSEKHGPSNVDWPYGGKDTPKKDWTDHEKLKLEAERVGPGEQGAPFKLSTDPETKAKEDKIYRVNGYDGLVSDYIPLNRSVKDIRHLDCQKQKYLSRLPTASVILATHNEHWSVLLRSCYSIIIRTPPELLKEIIIVDDKSTKDFLKKRLDDYVKENLPKVRVVHTTKREGLIRARQIGAQHATGEVMVFLDAHSEPNIDWMPPLLEPIAYDYRTVVCPFVDIIDCDTFEYRAQDEGARGSWDWEFNYKRLPVLKKNQKHPTDPFDSPVMAGGYFAISTKWFWELGGYDEGLDIWGGEQYELSFKIWQCHGRMVDVPCSRVGHIYRCKHVPFSNPGVGDFISRNYKRVAEVWMDEYKEFLYEKRPSMRNTDAGDLTKQLAVRERLKCKSFKWFMTEVAYDQDLYYPAREPIDGAKGRIKWLASSNAVPFCVDSQYKENVQLKLSPCGGGESNFRYTFFRDIRADGRTFCFDVSTSIKRAPVVLFSCHSLMGNQHWEYDPDKKRLFHPISGQCLDAEHETQKVFMNPCDENIASQQWEFSYVNRTVLDEWKRNPRTVD